MDPDFDPHASACPACGDHIDYCRGHGEIGDPLGAAILKAHDEGKHKNCHGAADCNDEDYDYVVGHKDEDGDWIADYGDFVLQVITDDPDGLVYIVEGPDGDVISGTYEGSLEDAKDTARAVADNEWDENGVSYRSSSKKNYELGYKDGFRDASADEVYIVLSVGEDSWSLIAAPTEGPLSPKVAAALENNDGVRPTTGEEIPGHVDTLTYANDYGEQYAYVEKGRVGQFWSVEDPWSDDPLGIVDIMPEFEDVDEEQNLSSIGQIESGKYGVMDTGG